MALLSKGDRYKSSSEYTMAAKDYLPSATTIASMISYEESVLRVKDMKIFELKLQLKKALEKE